MVLIVVNKLMLIAVVLFFSSCGVWWGTFRGIGFIPFFQNSTKEMKTTICNIEEKRIFLWGEDNFAGMTFDGSEGTTV